MAVEKQLKAIARWFGKSVTIINLFARSKRNLYINLNTHDLQKKLSAPIQKPPTSLVFHTPMRQ
jgi:hypothetical protein